MNDSNDQIRIILRCFHHKLVNSINFHQLGRFTNFTSKLDSVMYTWENEIGIIKMKDGVAIPSDLSPDSPQYYNQVRYHSSFIIHHSPLVHYSLYKPQRNHLLFSTTRSSREYDGSTLLLLRYCRHACDQIHQCQQEGRLTRSLHRPVHYCKQTYSRRRVGADSSTEGYS